jgi:serine/threonine-protein kinase
VLAKHVTEPAPPVASVAPEVPTKLARVIERCLRKEPEHRFEDGGAIAEALTQDSVVDRQSPIALSVYLRRLSKIDSGWAIIIGAGLYSLLDNLPDLVLSGPLGIATALAAATALLGGPVGYVIWCTREMLKAGYSTEAARLAWAQEEIRSKEESRATRKGLADQKSAARNVAIGGLGVGVFLAVAAGSLGLPLGPIAFPILVTGLMAAHFRLRRSKQLDNAREDGLTLPRPPVQWPAVSSRTENWLFKLSGLGLPQREVIGAVTYRPTEMVISTSAARLFEQLPKETRKTLAGLPGTLTELESHSRTLRQQVDDLDGVLAEIGDDPATAGHEARAKVRAEVKVTRDQAEARLRETVAALEAIRVGLLRMHAGERLLQNVTTELEAAKGLSDEMSDLLEGHREVERLLATRRTSGALPFLNDGVSTT